MARPVFMKLVMDEDTAREVAELAAYLRTTRSAVIRQAIARMHRAEQPPSLEEPAGERAA
jgi:predicted transcriptional regulator